jgi:hypothetical protein
MSPTFTLPFSHQPKAIMKRFPAVESVLTKVKFSQSRLERYFNSSGLNDHDLKKRLSNDFEPIATRSVQINANGHVQVVFAMDSESAVMSVDIPTSAHFLVTGIRTYKRPYRVAFAVSLS